MIDKEDIEKKDFSTALSGLCSKLSAVYSALIKVEGGGFDYNDEDILGFGLIVRDIYDDLSKISCALYGE